MTKHTEHESCKQNKKTYKEYHKTAINWFNRNKAKIFGTNLFHVLIFGHIFKVCYLCSFGYLTKVILEYLFVLYKIFSCVISNNPE